MKSPGFWPTYYSDVENAFFKLKIINNYKINYGTSIPQRL